MQIVERINRKLQKESMSVLTMSKQTGISAYKIYKWLGGKGNPKHEDSAILEQWLKGELEEVPHGTDVAFVKDNTLHAGEVKFTLTDLLQEKEARRREAEERAKKAEETNERLLALLETNLGNLAKDGRENTAAILSEIRGYGQQQIRMLVQYNDEEFAKAKQDADKIYLLNLRILLGDSMAGERKQDMHGKAERT